MKGQKTVLPPQDGYTDCRSYICTVCSSLRWHNPDQVQRVGVGGVTPKTPSQPGSPRLPWHRFTVNDTMSADCLQAMRISLAIRQQWGERGEACGEMSCNGFSTGAAEDAWWSSPSPSPPSSPPRGEEGGMCIARGERCSPNPSRAASGAARSAAGTCGG